MITSKFESEVMNAVVLPGGKYADPWRIYQDVLLLNKVCAECVDRFKDASVDIFAGVSDLGFPFAIALSYEYNKLLSCDSVAVLLRLDGNASSPSWVYPGIPVGGKTVVLCDDLLAGGGSMLKCLKRLEGEDAKLGGAVAIMDNGAEPVRTDADEVKRMLGEKLMTLTAVTSERYDQGEPRE